MRRIRIIRRTAPPICRENPSSLASSSRWKRTFSSSSTDPLPSARLFASASAPTQSPANSTGAPSRSASFEATGRKLYFASGLPFGRPR